MAGDMEMRIVAAALPVDGGCGDGYRGDGLTRRVIQCVIQVHQTLGPGFLESVYRRALLIELRKQDLATDTEKEVVIYYDGQKVGRHCVDLIVEGRVIVELKTVAALSKAHYAQVRSYLRATRLDIALLVNFATDRADFRRVEFPTSSPRSP
jgi:GxxExxY protein